MTHRRMLAGIVTLVLLAMYGVAGADQDLDYTGTETPNQVVLREDKPLSPEDASDYVKATESLFAEKVTSRTVTHSESLPPKIGRDAVFSSGGKGRIKVTAYEPENGDSIGAQCVAEYEYLYRSTQNQAKFWVVPDECSSEMQVVSMFIDWRKANVNSPAVRYPTLRNDQLCHFLNNWCRTPWTGTSHRIYSTQYVSAYFSFCWTYKGKLDCAGQQGEDWAYNDSGVRYPIFTDTRGHVMAVFPGPGVNGWNRCADDAQASPPCQRDPDFRQKTVDFHTLMGWRVPGVKYDAHHDIPLCKGGGNSATNGMFVYYSFHRGELHSWWRGFVTTRSGQPIATEADRILADLKSGIKPMACPDDDD